MDLFHQPASRAPAEEPRGPQVRSDVGRSNGLFLADLALQPIAEVRRRYAAGEYGADLHLPSLKAWARLAGHTL